MRFYGLALFASAAVLGACGGGENKGTTTDSAAQATSTAPAATTPAPGGAAAAAPITGTTHEVKMVGGRRHATALTHEAYTGESRSAE